MFLIVDGFYLVLPAQLTQRVSVTSKHSNHERIFLASIHWNNEKILRSHWNKAVLDLVKFLGTENVFVAVLESGSWDDSKGALQELDAQLAELDVHRSILLDNRTHEDDVYRTPPLNETGWLRTPSGRKELRRIPYLANLRNRVMLQMAKAMEAGGQDFTKVIWLNDVIFTVCPSPFCCRTVLLISM